MQDPRLASGGDRIMKLTGPLHFGTWGGMGSEVAYVLIGLTPLGMLITGVLNWRERREGLAANRARRPAAEAGAPARAPWEQYQRPYDAREEAREAKASPGRPAAAATFASRR